MNQVKKQFAEILNDVIFTEPKIPVIANVNALPYKHDNIKQNLIEQISSTVKWSESLCYIMKQGENKFFEISPGEKKIFLQLLPEIRTYLHLEQEEKYAKN